MTYLGLFLRLCSLQDVIHLLRQVQEHRIVNARAPRPRFVDYLLEFEERMINECVSIVLRDPGSRLQLVTTQTFIAKRPTYLQTQKERCERYMIWYSTNSVPILKKGEISQIYLPKELKNLYDHHLVWDQYQAEELESQGISNVDVKGAMVFVPRTSGVSRRSQRVKTVTIFDVTPVQPSIGYYTREMCEGNLKLMIVACEEASFQLARQISIVLKPKRSYSNRTDGDYITLIKSFRKIGRVEVVRPETNLYRLVAESNAVISVPFTSPAILAREVGVPSAFACTESKEWMIPNEHHGLPVIRSQRALADWLMEHLEA